MKRAIHLVAAALLVAACAAWQQDPISPGTSDVAKPADSAHVQVPLGLRTTPGGLSWVAYREFTFDSATVDISVSDTPKLREIVDRLERDPSLDIAIVGAADGASQADRNLSVRRAASVRRALMDTGAGVASYKIQMGQFADPGITRDGQIGIWVGSRTGSPRPL